VWLPLLQLAHLAFAVHDAIVLVATDDLLIVAAPMTTPQMVLPEARHGPHAKNQLNVSTV